MLNKNIIIIGITGVGKTTVGKSLADVLDVGFIDLDKAIENRCGVDIPTIFEIEGEAGFRLRETRELKKVLNYSGRYVISLGGGCVISDENRSLITNSSSIVIQLKADIETLVVRLSKSPSKRPLLENTDVTDKVSKLYEARRKFYDSITDVKFSTSQLKLNNVLDEIVTYLRQHKIYR